MNHLKAIIFCLVVGFDTSVWASEDQKPQVVRFPSDDLTLGGELYLPDGNGPFPTILYNHGSAPGMMSSMASSAIGPEFVRNGWAFFMPYRRGQGLSEDQGPYIMKQIKATWWNPLESAGNKLVELHQGAHLKDQMAALAWLHEQPFADKSRIATAGNSFGGIQVMLGMANADYCAGVNAAGAAESWQDSEKLRDVLTRAAVEANGPIFFFQAENDYDLSPSKQLSSSMLKAGKQAQLKIYPKFGSSKQDGHSLPFVASRFGLMMF